MRKQYRFLGSNILEYRRMCGCTIENEYLVR